MLSSFASMTCNSEQAAPNFGVPGGPAELAVDTLGWFLVFGLRPQAFCMSIVLFGRCHASTYCVQALKLEGTSNYCFAGCCVCGVRCQILTR